MAFSYSPSMSPNDEETVSEESDTRSRRYSRSHLHKHADTLSLSSPATEFLHVPFGINNATSVYSPSVSSNSFVAPYPPAFGSDSTLVRQSHTKHRKRKTCCRILLGFTISVILLSVIAVVSLAAYLGILTASPETAHSEVVHYEGSMRVVAGDDFSSLLLNKESEMFKEMAQRYQRMLDAVFKNSHLEKAYVRSRVEGFQKGSLIVFFSLYLDRRKFPSHLTASSKSVREVLIQEAMAFEPVSFKFPIAVDIDSIEIRQTKKQESARMKTTPVTFQKRIGEVESNPNDLDAEDVPEEVEEINDLNSKPKLTNKPTSEKTVTKTPTEELMNHRLNHSTKTASDVLTKTQLDGYTIYEDEVLEEVTNHVASKVHGDNERSDTVSDDTSVSGDNEQKSSIVGIADTKVVEEETEEDDSEFVDTHADVDRQSNHQQMEDGKFMLKHAEGSSFFPQEPLSDQLDLGVSADDSPWVPIIRLPFPKVEDGELSIPGEPMSSWDEPSHRADRLPVRILNDDVPVTTFKPSSSLNLEEPAPQVIPVLETVKLARGPVPVQLTTKEPQPTPTKGGSLFDRIVDIFSSRSTSESKPRGNESRTRWFTLPPSKPQLSTAPPENQENTQSANEEIVKELNDEVTGVERKRRSPVNLDLAEFPFLSLLNGTAKVTQAKSSIKHLEKTKLDELDSVLPNRRPALRPVLYHIDSPVVSSEGKPLSLDKKGKPTNSPIYTFRLQEGQNAQDILGELMNSYSVGGSPLKKLQNQLVIVNETSSSTSTTSSTTSTTTAKPFRRPSFPFPTRTRPNKNKFWVVQNTTKTNRAEEIDKAMDRSGEVTTTSEAPRAECKEDSFRCGSGECVASTSKCNQIKDCSDGSDEKTCTCADMLKAQSMDRKLCDGIVDCPDYSDESHCDWCAAEGFICPGSKVCIPQSQICDGKRDCPSGEDERRCVTIANDEAHANELTYSDTGYLMVRKEGRWGKLCADNLDAILDTAEEGWKMNDLGKAVCTSLTYRDHEAVNRTSDQPPTGRRIDGVGNYYEMVVIDSATPNVTGNEERPRSLSGRNLALDVKPTSCSKREVFEIKCKDLKCGMRPRATPGRSRRIVGGSNADVGSWPWQAALYKDGDFQCGATLVSERWLISAGHCFYHSADSHWVARLGALRRGSNFISPYEQLRVISHVILHPGYRDIGYINDISLLRLKEPVKFTDYVRPVCLPSDDTQIEDGRLCTVVGWGQLYETGRVFPDTLQEVQLPLVSTEECRKRTLFLPLYQPTENMFCAGFDRGGRDACLGDSGGPLMCQEEGGNWKLYGVTSNGYGCARANRPGVYTKVSKYMPWIRQVMAASLPPARLPKCSGHRCPLGDCLPASKVCNGIAECSDGSDEVNCSTKDKIFL